MLKQLGISVFVFLFILVLKFTPLEFTNSLTQNIGEVIYYNMTWDEAITTVKNTVGNIPLVKDWVEEDKTQNSSDKDRMEDCLIEEPNMPKDQILDIEQNGGELEDINLNKDEEIFILEPELGEPMELVIP